MKPFDQLSIIEIGGSIAGAYCARLFATNGARVTRIGDDSLTPAQRLYLHQGKTHLESAPPALLAEADVIIESAPYGPLASLDIPEASATAVRVRISPYGSTGPAANWHSTDATLYAHTGHMHMVGDPDREPLSAPPHHPTYASGGFAFIGAMAALFDLERHGRLNHVEIAHFEVLATLHQMNYMRYQFGGDIFRRMGNRYTGAGTPNGLYQCSDGWIAISASTQPQAQMLITVIDALDLFDDPRVDSIVDLQINIEILEARLKPWLIQRTMVEAAEFFQSARIPAAPATSPLGLLHDPHLAERDFWRTVDAADVVATDATDATGSTDAPEGTLDRLTVPGPPFRIGDPTDEPGAPAALDPNAEGNDPLSGMRVLDLTKVWAGPLAARLLAELGAEVIQVEAPSARGPRHMSDAAVQASRLFPNNEAGEQPWNRNGHQIKYALNKKSVVLDLQQPEGRATFERLVPHVDLVIENYSPRVMPQFGLDEHRLHELNPNLIYMTMPGYGRSGPAMNWVAYGTTIDSHAGLSHLIGYDGQTPWKCGVAWPDPIAGLHAVSAILIALWRRSTDGGGVTIELAQLESTISVVGDALVQAQLLGHDPAVLGNRHPNFAPQGVYPTTGDDHYIALSVLDDHAWRTLCTTANLPEAWQALDVDARRAIHDEIDDALAAWTATHHHIALADQLQQLGITAAPVLDAPGVLADPQLAARDALAEIDQPQAARFLTPRSPIHFSQLPHNTPLRPSPLLGQHNDEVLTQLAGLTPEEIAHLVATGVVADKPPQ